MTARNKGFLSDQKHYSTHKGDGCQTGLHHNKSFCTQKVSPTKGTVPRRAQPYTVGETPGQLQIEQPMTPSVLGWTPVL